MCVCVYDSVVRVDVRGGLKQELDTRSEYVFGDRSTAPDSAARAKGCIRRRAAK